VKFTIDQTVAVAPEVALAAYGNPAFYEGRPPRDNISVLGVVSHEDTGALVVIEVRFKFTGTVSPAVRALVDPNKMSWVTRTEVDAAGRRTRWEVVPEHYPDRLTAQGTYRFTDGPGGADSTAIAVEGDLKVHVPFVGRTVERVIVSGLRSYIATEVKGIPDVPLA
jgi:hypothetical protein